jgi:hypothetical protein
MRAIILLLLCIAAFGQTSLDKSTDSPGTAQRNTYVFGPANNITLGNFTSEFRIHGLSGSIGTDRLIWGFPDGFPIYKCFISANTTTLNCAFGNDSDGNVGPVLSWSGQTDIRVRFTRSGTLNQQQIVLCSGNGAFLASKSVNLTNTDNAFTTVSGTQFSVGGGLKTAWLRFKGTADFSQACPTDTTPGGTWLLDFPFEGSDTSLVTSSAATGSRVLNGSNGTQDGSGTVASTSTPTYNPIPSITAGNAFRAGGIRAGVVAPIDGSLSFASAGTGAISSYKWWSTCVNGLCPTFGSDTSVNPNIMFPVAGEYSVTLQVCDSVPVCSNTSKLVGVVASDAQGIVIHPSKEMQIILGSFVKHGSEPYPWYTVTHTAVAEHLTSVEYSSGGQPKLYNDLGVQQPAATLLPGTATVSSTAPNGTRTYNGITVIYKDMGPWVVGTGTNWLTSVSVNDNLWFASDCNSNGNYDCYYFRSVAEVASNTSIRLSGDDWSLPETKSSNMRVYKLGGSTILPTGYRAESNSGENPWGYYDAGLGMYRLCYETGLSTYCNTARTFGKKWWTYALGGGYRDRIVARNSAWQYMIALAADLQSGLPSQSLWDGIEYSLQLSGTGATGPTTPFVREDWGWVPNAGDDVSKSPDLRESAYTLRDAAVFARVYPPHASNPSAARTKWCGIVKNLALNQWVVSENGKGYWEENMTRESVHYPAARLVDGTYGVAPWRSVALGLLALEYAHDALADTDPVYGCNDPTSAATILPVIQRVGQWYWDNARSVDKGVFAFVNSRTRHYDDPNELRVLSENELPTNHRVSIANGSSTVIGTNTTFLTTFTPCDGSTYIGIDGTDNNYNRVFKVTACSDDTHLTIETAYPYPSVVGASWSGSGANYAKTVIAETNCGAQTQVTYCEPDLYSGRNLSFDAAAGAAWLYVKTNNIAWRDRADTYLGAFAGGPAGGAGSTGPGVGPNADGNTGNLADVLPSCTTNSAPCGGGNATMRGKQFGMSTGAGDIPVALANRLGGITSIPRTLSVAYKLNHPLATSVQLVLTFTDGSTTTQPCGSSPCSVSVDAKHPISNVVIQEKSSGNAVVMSNAVTWKLQ